MFHLTIGSYPLLCLYVVATCFVVMRWPGAAPWRRTAIIVLTLLGLGTAWMAWAFVVPRHHPHATGDYTYESVGCLLACLTGLYGLVWTVRARALSGLLPLFGAAWLLMLYANLIAQT
ncbi:MAG: hypothetical protein WA294_01005 [Acidobacteriaceae bacterium]